ncbi:MAG: adenylosuccinate lyase family protein [Beijerinckiaceae bacterium]|nr:adenylosuccinate lyase family protein [Beijerinckiaceae bacterium]
MTFSALDSELTGPLFATAAMREVFSDRRKITELLRCEVALARVQARFGLAPDALAQAIEAVGLAAFDLSALGVATERSGVPSIPFLAALKRQLPDALEPALHRGATTQDILDTALVLQMRAAFDLIEIDLAAIVLALVALAERHRSQPCVGRTYGQHAAPLTFGYKVSIWCTALADCLQRLTALRRHVLVASLAGPVGTLSALGDKGPAIAEAFAKELGLESSVTAWHTARGPMVEVASWLAMLIGSLAKMAGDIVHLTSTEVGEAFEPVLAGRGGSSAMPHKRNPVASTIILAAHGAAKGHVVTMLDAMSASHERPAGAWHSEWHALPQLFGLASGALREALILGQGLTIDASRMEANIALTRGLIFSEAVAAKLAPTFGRERAHASVERASERVRETGLPLAEALIADPDLVGTNGGDAAKAGLEALLRAAFDLAPAVEAATLWTELALDHARTILADSAARRTARKA